MVQIGRSRFSVKMHRTCYLFFFTLLAVLYSTHGDHHHQSPRGSEYDDDYDDDLDDYLYDDYGEKKPSSGGGAGGAPAETSALNFVRLLVLRLVWGFASMFGVQEGLEDFMGGIFVPPGVESDDDFDLGF